MNDHNYHQTMMMTTTTIIRSVIRLNGRNGMIPAALVGVGVGVCVDDRVVGTGVGGLRVNNPKTVVCVIFALTVRMDGFTVVWRSSHWDVAVLYHLIERSWFASAFQSLSGSVMIIVTYGSNVAPLGSTSYAIPVKL